LKIAFVDYMSVMGGLSRFSFLLAKSLMEVDEDIDITYFAHVANIKNTPELIKLNSARFKLVPLKSTSELSFNEKVKNKLFNRPFNTETKLKKEIKEKLTNFDLAYFPSAHMMDYHELGIPIAGTIHDFNWKYFFGREIFGNAYAIKMDKEIPKWLEKAYTITSSNFVASETRKFFPGYKNYPEVVNIAPVIFESTMSKDRTEKIIKSLGLDYPYLVFPGNFFPHKNHLNLFSAFFLLTNNPLFSDLKLVLTGQGSDQVPFGKAEINGLSRVSTVASNADFNIRGMGYLTNEQIDAVIRNAKLLISPSIYEAICTPAMDAWSFGTPTAISDIPPFREHEQVWGIKTCFFNPMNPIEIASSISHYLENYDIALQDGAISKQNILKYSWHDVAKGYLRVFHKAISNYK
jgi:glycosyltransferase involved in cell wall biosynthesis